MSAPASNIQLSIANSLPIIKATVSTLVQLNTPPTVATEEEISYRSHLTKVLAMYSKTGQPDNYNGAIDPGVIDPLVIAVNEAKVAHAAAKTNDDFASTKATLVAAQEAVVEYYTTVIAGI